jgi:trk system potassium uptake protein TrkH
VRVIVVSLMCQVTYARAGDFVPLIWELSCFWCVRANQNKGSQHEFFQHNRGRQDVISHDSLHAGGAGVTLSSGFHDGADTLRHAARGSVVLLTLAKHAPIFTMLFGPPALWAVALGEMDLALALAVPGAAGAVLFLGVWRLDLPKDLRGVEALVTVALVFLLAALLSAPAFMVLGMPLVDAVFEAMSGITTTGLSVASNPDDWSYAAHFLRAWLQWIGGLVMATAVLALILPPGMSTRKLGQAGMDQSDRIASTRRQARQLLLVYVAATALLTAISATLLPDPRDGLMLTLSAVSTGGFAPRSDSLASYSALGQGVIILGCIVGAVSLLTFVLLLQGKFREAWTLGSARRVLLFLGGICGAYALVLVARGSASAEQVYGELLNLISAVTTAGYATGPVPVTGVALVIFLVAMTVGADVGSTGGGLKIARLALAGRAVRHAVRAPSLPDRAVAPLRQDGREVNPATMVSFIGLAALYFAAVMIVWALFLAHGHAPAAALFDTISALSTVGLSSGVVGADLSDTLKLALTFVMWLGRLEFIAVLVLLAPGTWLRKG